MQKHLMFAGAGGLIVGAVLFGAGFARLGEHPPKLTWRDPEIKSALMPLGYKVYGNPNVEFGRHYLSKLVFQNTGGRPVTDFAISYKIDDYIPWTDPEEHRVIPAGFTLVKLYHPRLPAQVTKIRNATNSTFRVRVLWKEGGRAREETFTRNIVLRGVNEMAWSDLPASEVRSWFDTQNAAAFSVCMVTPNDPVVTLYAAEVTKLAGGTTAGIAGGTREIGRLCRQIYDYMMATQLRYTGASGVVESVDNITSMIQTVRMPRDVIINNQGLCVELSILWSSILDHLGLHSAMVFVPGHVFIVVYSPDQNIPLDQGLPIECTAITQRAVEQGLAELRGEKADAPATFDEAVALGKKGWDRAMASGRFIIVPVKELQAAGYIAPELADIDTDKLTETLAKRLPVAEAGLERARQNGAIGDHELVRQVDEAGPAGLQTWRHPQGLVSLSMPAEFVSLQQPGTPAFVLLSMGNPMTSVTCEVMHITGTQDPQQAVGYVTQYYAQMGAMIQVTGTSAASGGAVLLSGTTTTGAGAARWMCLARPVPGGVLLVSAGAGAPQWGARSAAVQAILSTVRFNDPLLRR